MEKELTKLLLEYDYLYHTLGEPSITDIEYDKLKDDLYKLNSKNIYFTKIGANFNTDSVKLPYYMGSLDKIKDTDIKQLNSWIKKFKGPYLISDKLDGISALLDYKKGIVNIYTRGNGTEGRNINYILEHLKNIPKSMDKDICIRGELILSKENWNEKYGSNARNVVAGLINSKTLKPELLKLLKFVVYDIIYPRTNNINSLKSNFEIVYNENIPTEKLNIEKLLDILNKRKLNSEYEIDGIVITDIDKDENKLIKNQNPKYSIAFKSIYNLEEREIIVENIEWNISKDGYIKPRILFKPIKLDGVMISATTGFNASFIVNNKINIGSKLGIIRSGGVIPKVQRIITQSKEPLMPTINYKWNNTNVDILIDNSDINEEVNIKKITFFMKTLNIKNFAEITIKKLYNAGFTDIVKLINITIDDIKKLDGFGDKSANNLVNNLKTIKDKELYEIMAASNIFGRNLGIKTLKLLTKKLESLTAPEHILITPSEGGKYELKNLLEINGIGPINAKSFIENIDTFKKFYIDIGFTLENPKTPDKKSPKTQDKKSPKTQDKKSPKTEDKEIFKDELIVFSGFRDKNLEKFIEKRGGEIVTNVTKKTTLLIVNSINDKSSKIKNGEKFNVKIVEKNTFVNINNYDGNKF